jgi:quercetin dioxygenase-like cupin family protein
LDLSFDLRHAPFFYQNDQNFILQQFGNQLPVMKNLGLLDIYLSKGHSVEPHWHPNAAELVYAIEGEGIIGILNPFTNQVLHYRIQSPQTVYIPMGWWHWEIGAAERNHLLAIFDSEAAQVVFGSDVLRKTPPEVFQLVYGVDAAQIAQALEPIDRTVVIGSPAGAEPQRRRGT